jgi:outer membrane protein
LLLVNQERLEQVSSTLAVQVEQGFAPETALMEVNLKKKELALKLIDLENGYSQLLRYLQMLIGLSPTGEITLDESLEEGWLSQIETMEMAEENTEAQLLSQKKELNELMYKVESADYLPSVDLNADIQWQAQRQNFGFFDGNEWQNINLLGLDINIPIYSGGNKTVAKQQLLIENQKLEIDRSQLSSYQELSQARAAEDYQSKVKRLQVTKEYLDLRMQMYDLTNLKYEQEISTINELMEAQVARQSAELNHEQAKNALILAALDVLKANNQMEVLLQ